MLSILYSSRHSMIHVDRLVCLTLQSQVTLSTSNWCTSGYLPTLKLLSFIAEMWFLKSRWIKIFSQSIDAKTACGCLNICAWLCQLCLVVPIVFLRIEDGRLCGAAVALFQVRGVIAERNLCMIEPQGCIHTAQNNKVGKGFSKHDAASRSWN